jgi:hypothetical protein
MLLHFLGFSNLTWIILVQIANGSLFRCAGPVAGRLRADGGSRQYRDPP